MCVPLSATVREATREMVKQRVGAVAVLKGDVLVGIFTERDLMVRVANEDLSCDVVKLEDVLTTNPVTIDAKQSRRAALELMLEHHCRHLPVVDERGAILGMLSIRHLYKDRLRSLDGQMRSMESYFGADGIGG